MRILEDKFGQVSNKSFDILVSFVFVWMRGSYENYSAICALKVLFNAVLSFRSAAQYSEKERGRKDRISERERRERNWYDYRSL